MNRPHMCMPDEVKLTECHDCGVMINRETKEFTHISIPANTTINQQFAYTPPQGYTVIGIGQADTTASMKSVYYDGGRVYMALRNYTTTDDDFNVSFDIISYKYN